MDANVCGSNLAMENQDALLSLLALLGDLGSSGLLLLALALLVRGDLVSKTALKAIVAEAVEEVLERLQTKKNRA